MEKFLGRRVVQEFLDDSVLDDAIIKQVIKKYIDQFDSLRKEPDPMQMRYTQGFIAALDWTINTMREQQRRSVVKEDED